MNVEATAEALAPDTAMPVEAPVQEETPSEEATLEAAYDRAMETDEPETADVVEETVSEEPTDEAPEVAVDTPPDIPGALKDVWSEMPAQAREAVLASQRDLSQKLSTQGRLLTAVKPIQDVLVKATKELPALSNLKPEQAAAQIFHLAKVSADFNTNPLDAMMGLVEKHGLQTQLAQRLAGQPVTAENTSALNQKIEKLEGQLAQFADPEQLKSFIAQYSAESAIQSSVEKFASTADHWDAVESHIPTLIPVMQAKLGGAASEDDVLTAAYELAVSQFVPNAKAPQEIASDEDAVVVDPERSKAAIKAKSVNVKAKQGGKARQLTEDERLSAIYDSLQN